MAKHFATHAGSVKRAFQLALAREPAAEELAALEDYAKREGLENACRVILNLNEFSFID
jgi:type IV secretory pathway VirD2 relaxase